MPTKALGVSQVTLRRWNDALGRFRARRHPINDYRMYESSEAWSRESE